MQYTVDGLSHTARSLAAQQADAERHLTEYANRRDNLESTLKQLREQMSGEKTRVDELRVMLASQQDALKVCHFRCASGRVVGSICFIECTQMFYIFE